MVMVFFVNLSVKSMAMAPRARPIATVFGVKRYCLI